MTKALQTFTENSFEQILARGGDYDWVVSVSNAKSCKYLVCCHSGGTDRGAGFLIGKISHVEFTIVDTKGKSRYLIGISEVAHIHLPQLWNGQQNPVRYTSLEELGIDLSELKFGKVSPTKSEALTIEQAKAGLAKQFGVSPESIEITIKG
ncbi:MAG: hypothetical protein HC860_13695 [Alkalinema sp. RU_4_3]|nr:hypothetical protein [Alkalinema sp. RU_4_3]NJR71411.1 hypothetical protein [Synechococcales cyanobacterium CRU_2_2]